MRAVIIAVLMLGAGTPRPAYQRLEAVEPHMGTLVRITVYTRTPAEATAAFRLAFARIRELDRILSDYRADSELNRVARTAVGRDVRVSRDLFTVLGKAQELARESGGAFDVTQGPVVRLWREARASGRLPEQSALAAAAARTGYRKLHLDTRRRTVRLDEDGMALDLGAIGKGYAASQAVRAMTRTGVRSALVAVSGDIAFSDAPPGQRGWRIALGSSGQPVPGLPHALELSNAAVSTAGASEQHLDVDGRRYSHIVDPGSNMGLVNDATVTVVASDGLDADGLDTAASVLGRERGIALVDRHPLAAVLFVEQTETGPHVSTSKRFRELIEQAGVTTAR